MAFLVHVDPFTFLDERRYFVAERDGRPVGFLSAIPIYARPGWFFEDFLRDRDAPNGTVELLVDAGMCAAAAERIPYVTLGLVPLSGEISPWLRARGAGASRCTTSTGLRAFQGQAETTHVGSDLPVRTHRANGGFVAMFDTLTAFARGGLLRFGLETLLRGPAIVMRVLAVLLLAWTAMLALPLGARWFPVAGVAVRLGRVRWRARGLLLTLSYRWRAVLADVLACAVTGDALVTLVQAIVYDLPHRRGLPGHLRRSWSRSARRRSPRSSCGMRELTARSDSQPSPRYHGMGYGIRMIGRMDVERAILDEESMLEQIAGFIERGAEFAGWPEDVRTALALEDGSISQPEIECQLSRFG